MRAYIDESYEAGPNGLYVLAAVLAPDDDTMLRNAMLELRQPRTRLKLHFHGAEPERQARYLDTVGRMARYKLAIVVRPCKRPERARRMAMIRLLWELRDKADALLIESRGSQNKDDVALLRATQKTHGTFRYEFPLGRDEPVLWAADILASGIFHVHQRKQAWMLDRLGHVAQHHVEVD